LFFSPDKIFIIKCMKYDEENGGVDMKDTLCFKRLGTMVDCSRTAVMTVESLKHWIDITSDMGYNTLQIYMEDIYEIEGHPYFGYKRGRYTKKEIKELDAYALSKGMELIPCIQTLAHTGFISRWPEYASHMDALDVLLIGDEKTYRLIDKMFATVSECFSGRLINMGMDEAFVMGNGKYRELHGSCDRYQLFMDHVKRVAEIGRKYGFRMLIWSDMFFHMVGTYYNYNIKLREEIIKQIPEDVELIYWDYSLNKKKHFHTMFEIHDKIKPGTWFAAGAGIESGLSPALDVSMKSTKASFEICRQRGVENVFVCLWGGGAISKYTTLPSLFYAAENAKGNMDMNRIKAKFKEKFHVPFDAFKLMELPHTASEPMRNKTGLGNADFYLMFNDCFAGLLDSTLAGGEGEQYAACAEKLKRYINHPEWGWLFKEKYALCETLKIKAEIGVKTRRVYAEKDREQLRLLIEEYKVLEKNLDTFYYALKERWFLEYKPQGFENQDIRWGAAMRRVRSCRERLENYYDGKISAIEELEETQLDYFGGGETFKKESVYFSNWYQAISANCHYTI